MYSPFYNKHCRGFFLIYSFFLFLSSSQIALNSETLAVVLNDTATLIRDPHSLSALDVVYVTNIIQMSLDRTTVSAEVKTIFQSFEAIMQLRAWSSPFCMLLWLLLLTSH